MISPGRTIYIYVEKEKKKIPNGDGAHASDSIHRYEKKAYFPDGLLKCPFRYQIFTLFYCIQNLFQWPQSFVSS